MTDQPTTSQNTPQAAHSASPWRQRAARLARRLFGEDAAGDSALRPYYEQRAPSAQTIIDVFGDNWKSALPGASAGDTPMFDDGRIHWLNERLPGGLRGQSILELGPFEGYHSFQLDRLGAGEVLAVEGNSINFLKCLCVKEIYQLRTHFALGDIQAFLDACQRRFDVVIASGVLYHSQDPVAFIREATRIADHLYLWTHHYAPDVHSLANGQEKHFLPARNRTQQIDGRAITLHARSYLRPTYRSNLPLYWEGGQQDLAWWLTREDLYWLIEHAGFTVIANDGGGNVNGLPCIGLYARRRTD